MLPSTQTIWRTRILAAGIVASAGIGAVCADSAKRDDAAAPMAQWLVINRSISASSATWHTWRVDYRLRNQSNKAISLAPGEFQAQVEGFVSNSRVPTHSTARPARQALTGFKLTSAVAEIIPSGDESRRCRERLTAQAWPAALGAEPPPKPVAGDIEISPGDVLCVRLQLAHEHFLYGPYDALLGRRDVVLKLAAADIHDVLPLDDDRRVARSIPAWPSIESAPAEQRDRRTYLSPPESLHLSAHVPGRQSYQFAECPVQYATKMRLRYWYLIAPGTEGECRSRLIQYREAPSAWKILSEGEQEQSLTTVGRWTCVERVFRTEPEATSLRLEFRVLGDVGELWVDDIALEPVDEDRNRP